MDSFLMDAHHQQLIEDEFNHSSPAMESRKPPSNTGLPSNNSSETASASHEQDEASSTSFSSNSSDYDVGSAIGFGSSAVVYLATYRPTGKKIAIKMIDLDRFERNQIDELRKEIQVMCLCRHANLLRILASFVVQNKLWIVMPFLSAGSCLDVLKAYSPEGLKETLIASILYQALLGIEYLHKNNLIHRDIKAGNLILDADGQVFLADFGVSASLMDDGERKGIRKTFVGTPCWMAPEVMEMNRGYDFKADIWSFGITALELANGSAPFAKFPPMKVIYLTLSSKPPTLDRSKTHHKYTKQFKDVIDACLQLDPTKRPTAEALLKHAFFKSAKKKAYIAEFLQSVSPLQHSALAASAAKTLAPLSAENNEQQQATPSNLPQEQAEASGNWSFSESESVNGDEVGSSSSSNTSAAGTTVNSAAIKKSRFIVDAGSATASVPKKESSSCSSSDTDTALSATATVQAGQSSEIRRGRFSVSEAKLLSTTTTTSTNEQQPPTNEVKSANSQPAATQPPSLAKQSPNTSSITSPLPMVDTLILRQSSSKVGRFTVDDADENTPQGSKFSLQNTFQSNNTASDYAIVSRRDLEALLESNNAMRTQLDKKQKLEEERTRNPLSILKSLEQSLKAVLSVKDPNPQQPGNKCE